MPMEMVNDSAEVHEVDKLSFVILRTPLQSGGGRGEARIACRTCCDKKVKLTFTQNFSNFGTKNWACTVMHIVI